MMRKLLFIPFCLILSGCSKSNNPAPPAKDQYHFTITSTDNSEKYVISHGVAKREFTDETFDSDLNISKGDSLSVSTGFETQGVHSLRLVITKNGTVIADQSTSLSVSVKTLAP
jgi:hypothetical protein